MSFNPAKKAAMIGTVSALVSGGTVMALVLRIWSDPQLGSSTLMILGSLAALSMVAARAAYTSRPWILLTVFIVSFVPVGFYLLLLPNWIRIAGIAQLGYLWAALLILFHSNRNGRAAK